MGIDEATVELSIRRTFIVVRPRDAHPALRELRKNATTKPRADYRSNLHSPLCKCAVYNLVTVNSPSKGSQNLISLRVYNKVSIRI